MKRQRLYPERGPFASSSTLATRTRGRASEPYSDYAVEIYEGRTACRNPAALTQRPNFRIARENEAAGAADAAAWVMPAFLIFGSDKLWVTRRCPCDPSTHNDAGGTPASSLL